MELTKSEKKTARQIIEMGLEKEFAKGLSEAYEILSEWKKNPSDNKASYHALFKHVDEFDNHISDRYDRMTGSNYLWIITQQLRDGFISAEDLKPFPKDLQARLLGFNHKGYL